MNEASAVDVAMSPTNASTRTASVYERRWKRATDIVVSIVAMVVLTPVVLLIVLAILVGLGRPVLYHQERVGRYGESFTILKFRTMRPDRRAVNANVDIDRRQTHKHNADPRHTGLGRLLRRSSLDELPQLWNVLRGDMSVVGPRPELVELAERGGFRNHVRHDVRPGITGLFQTSELRSVGDLSEGLDLDRAYVADVTFRGDFRILLRTAALLLTGRAVGS